jgi:hypothetical protein
MKQLDSLIKHKARVWVGHAKQREDIWLGKNKMKQLIFILKLNNRSTIYLFFSVAFYFSFSVYTVHCIRVHVHM